ncbi:glycosyltransferase [Phaeobacter sp. B1627]|uniref:glycosyltransferase n=1 Tax=Phaeobacter sp. B1627 TaxID=2583809 RepID=UPI00111A3A69|nr:glycosyltransferase [Phaeobacter sp. B1627]TNJ40964.1 glycosyltransferase [Phaeobacter sp. B1627]
MKILRIISSVDPAHGGPVEGMRQSALRHRDLGIETEVLSVDSPDSPHVTAFPTKVHAMGRITERYGYSSGLGRWISGHAQEYDAAVVHGMWNHAAVGGGRALVRTGLPYVVFTHGMMDPWFKTAYPVKHFAKQLFLWALQGRVLTKAQKVLFTSAEEMRLAKEAFPRITYQGQVVAYGSAVPDVSDHTVAEKEFRAFCPDLGSAPYLLYLSRIHPKKGVDILLKAFAQITASRPKLHLVVAGPGEARLMDSMQAEVQTLGLTERVHFPGIVTGTPKWGAYLGAEAFALPSHQENFGIAVAEALGCGTPVITTDKVNIWREIKVADAGFISGDNVVDFTRALQKWVDLADERKAEMRIAAKACHTRQFSAEAASVALKEVLESISTRSSPTL